MLRRLSKNTGFLRGSARVQTSESLPSLESRRLRPSSLNLSPMDKRAILAIGLSILILVVYQECVTRYYGAPPSAPEAEKTRAGEGAGAVSQPAPAAPVQTKPVALPVSREVKDVRVETDNYIAVFTNQGARLKSFKFKKYRSSVAENSPPFEIVSPAPGVPFPLGIRWQNPAAVR